MKRDYYESFSLADIGHEMIRASRYEAMYNELLERYNALQEEFTQHLERENSHHQQMMGGFLSLALKTSEEDK